MRMLYIHNEDTRISITRMLYLFIMRILTSVESGWTPLLGGSCSPAPSPRSETSASCLSAVGKFSEFKTVNRGQIYILYKYRKKKLGAFWCLQFFLFIRTFTWLFDFTDNAENGK